MVKHYGVDISITTTDLKPFTEYGNQQGRKFSTAKGWVTTWIEARDQVQFFVRITPDKPYKFDEYDSQDAVARAFANVGATARTVTSTHSLRNRHWDENRPVEEEKDDSLIPATVSDGRESAASEIQPVAAKARFDLMLSVYIDNREKPECRQIIYLDPAHPRWSSCCVMKGRWIEVEKIFVEGKAGLLQWVFTDRGIDHILEKISIQNDDSKRDISVDDTELENITKCLGDEAIIGEEERQQKPIKDGQIEVRIRRVVPVTADQSEGKFRAYHFPGTDEKPAGSLGIDDDCTHTTSFKPKMSSDGRPKPETFQIRQVAWNYYHKNEDAWARIFFKYSARSKLMKMGLCNLDGSPRVEDVPKAIVPEVSKAETKKRSASLTKDSDDEEKRKFKAVRASSDDSNSSEEETEGTLGSIHHAGRRFRATRARLDKNVRVEVKEEKKSN